MRKNILVVVDMQNDFIDGSLGTKEAQAIVPKVCNFLNKWKDKSPIVMVTRDTHWSDYLDTQEGHKLPIKHCIYQTPGWNINAAVQEALNELPQDYLTYLDKGTFGAGDLFIGLQELLEGDKGENFNIHFVGLCTDICVIANAILAKTALPEARIIVHKDLCAGVTPASHQTALDAMKTLQIDIE